MEPVAAYLKNVHSPLYDRRLALIILKKYSYGRRSFTENARSPKIKDQHRERHYEPEVQTKEKEFNKEAKAKAIDPRFRDSDDASE
jgi:hypothetical protein